MVQDLMTNFMKNLLNRRIFHGYDWVWTTEKVSENLNLKIISRSLYC
jgi:hypothetical protein